MSVPKICRICMISVESIECLPIFELPFNVFEEGASILEKLSSINIQVFQFNIFFISIYRLTNRTNNE
jgi:hypothetical protein